MTTTMKELFELADKIQTHMERPDAEHSETALREMGLTVTSIRVLAYLEALREEEGASVEIVCPNPDGAGSDNEVVCCCASWTGHAMHSYETERFTGESLVLSLKAAYDAMMGRPA